MSDQCSLCGEAMEGHGYWNACQTPERRVVRLESQLSQALRELGEAREEVAREHAAHEETWASHQQVRKHRDDLAERLQTAERSCDAALRSAAELRGALEAIAGGSFVGASTAALNGTFAVELQNIARTALASSSTYAGFNIVEDRSVPPDLIVAVHPATSTKETP